MAGRDCACQIDAQSITGLIWMGVAAKSGEALGDPGHSPLLTRGGPGSTRNLERVVLNRVHPTERNRNVTCLCWSWIVFNLNQIEGNSI
jgi:hypothetical protein